MNNFRNIDRPTLRRSQTITTFGVGSIVDLPDDSVMICGIDKWSTKGCEPLHDERLEEKLRVSHFYMPPNVDQSNEGILAVRFPRYLRCRGYCKRLSNIDVWRDRAHKIGFSRDFDKKPYCDIDKINLIPARFVVACRKGHIDDFPYIEWVHAGKGICSSPSLTYSEGNGGAGLQGIIIKCQCKEKRNMGGSFSKDLLKEVASCSGSKPWEMIWSSKCGEQLTTLQRGSSNIHFPRIQSSILIPPYTSEGLRSSICKTELWNVFESQDGAMPVDVFIEPIAKEINEKVEVVKKEIEKMLSISDEDVILDEENYRFQEFMAFNGNIPTDTNEKDFLVQKIIGSKYRIPHIESVTLVKRLREIRVQTGFTRIKPASAVGDGDENDTTEEIEVVPMSEKKKGWLPGYEVRGEGIFLNFDVKNVISWENNISNTPRQKKIAARGKRNPDPFGIVETLTPGLLAIHTLSHLLIRQLSFECGYSSSSLRERIYYSSNKKHPMAGLLIYTADGDSDGTLGGLVRQGEPDYLNDIVKKSLRESEWCSSDPLCIESDGQGYLGLNMAACHACALLPETSCELLNRYLDRGSVSGTLNGEKGLFSEK